MQSRYPTTFRDFFTHRSSGEGMARMSLYAAYRHQTYKIKKSAGKKTRDVGHVESCPTCNTTYPFKSRVRVRVKRKAGKKQKNLTVTETCTLCRSPIAREDRQKTDTMDGTETGVKDGIYEHETSPVTPRPTPKTPTSTNLSKLMSAKKRQSLNKETGLLDFLIKSTTKN